MVKNEIWKRSFEDARLIVYLVFAANLFFAVFLSPFPTVCDFSDDPLCLACGMTRAVELLLQLDFAGAYVSNHFIIILVIVTICILVDIVHITYQRRKNK